MLKLIKEENELKKKFLLIYTKQNAKDPCGFIFQLINGAPNAKMKVLFIKDLGVLKCFMRSTN